VGKSPHIKIDWLNGGYSPAKLFRIEVGFGDREQNLSLVQKVTTPEEVQVMLVLPEIPDANSAPELIDYCWWL